MPKKPKKNVDVPTEKELQTALCFTNTIDHYGNIPYECKECLDVDICVALEDALIKSKKKGGDK